MNSLVWKVGGGVGASTAVAGTIGIVSHTSKKVAVPIKTLLSKGRPDKRLLFAARGAADPDWKAAWQRYINGYAGFKGNPFSLKTFTEGDAPAAFMSKCEGLFEEKAVDESDDKYNLALEFCTRDTLVSDFIWEQGKQALSDKNSNQWSSLWTQYKSNGDLWKLNKPSDSNAPNEFKDRCIKETTSKAKDARAPEVLAALNYCSIVRAGNS
ncbi:hypothetical protein MHF_0416 [Mycoplasma haemofelis Ohio2]|uniref:Uncharacterized protein n=1 Tax=Mycoplasma haemofelis (strain Ohio2) TaxID=859194 RepID=F6FH87_MYCHI|nr:hypothetical protein MHF_0416 [Mycoplasma haemofelis Ohio2]